MSTFKNLLMKKRTSEKRYYCEVEYLESSATLQNYLNTGVSGYSKNKLNIDIIFSYSELSSTDNISPYGSTMKGAPGTFCSISSNGTTYINGGTPISNFNTSINTKYRLVTQGTSCSKYDLEAKTSVHSSCSVSTRIIENNIILFGRLFVDPDTQTVISQLIGTTRIYACKIYNDSQLIRDYIPVLDWDLRPAMYDKVTGTLTYSATSDDFSYGREIHYVEYIQSSETQYIETGLLNTDLTLEYTAKCSDLSVARGQIFLAVAESTSWVGWLNGATSPALSPSVDVSDYRDYRVVYNETRIELTDIATQRSGSTTNTSIPETLKLFSYGSGGYASNTALKKMKIWQGSTLVRDYLPAVDEYGVGGLFDKVERKFYYNAGTGAFEYPELNLLSLSSTGTQWLNTGVVANNTMCIQFDAGYDSLDENYNRLAGTQIGLAQTLNVRSSTQSGGGYYTEGLKLDGTAGTFTSSFNVDLLKHHWIFNDYSVFKLDNETMDNIKKIPDDFLNKPFGLFCNVGSSGNPLNISHSRFYTFFILENTLALGYREVEYIQINNGASDGLRNRIEISTTWADIDEIDFTVATRELGRSMLISGKTSASTFYGSQPYITLYENALSINSQGFDESPTITPSTMTDRQGTFTTVAITGISVSGDTANSPICFGAWGDTAYSKTNQFKEIILKKNDVIVSDLKPCIRISDNVAGMYDVTNSVFYPNAESGKLNMITAGPLKYLMNLKPVLTNGVGRFYDEVSGTYKSNAGTGDFVLGKIEEDGRFPNV